MAPPNILYLHSHDTGRYIQPYGHAAPTPNLQRLAEQGVLFRQAFCANPTCSASRSTLVTGMYPHNNGMTGLAHRGFSLCDYRQHLVHTLQQAGYYAALSGAQHVDAGPEGYGRRIGYDVILDDEDREAGGRGMTQVRAAEFLHNAPPQPFFLAVGFGETHRSFPDPGPDDNPNYCLPPAPFPDTPETRRDMAGFYTHARTLDNKMGAVLAALDDSGLGDNTLVVCTTDHGIAFPHMKCNLFDHGLGVMLIVRGPAGFSGGKAIDAMVGHIDVFPTVCDVAGIEPPAWLQGESLRPLVNGEADTVRDEIFAEVNYHAAYEPMRAARTERWKYIRRFDERTTPVLPNCDDSPTKTLWVEHGWPQRPVAAEQLYDLVFDPHETNNLAGDPAHAEALAEMQGRLRAWMERTADPLLDGPVPAPKDAVVTPANAYSPRHR